MSPFHPSGTLIQDVQPRNQHLRRRQDQGEEAVIAALILPIQSGMTQLVRETLDEMVEQRAAEMEACCERSDIDWVSWHLAVLPARDYLVIHLRGDGSASFLIRLDTSHDPFDRWLRSCLVAITGSDSGWLRAAQWLIPLGEAHVS
jgi:hypothetical protein